MLRGERPVSDRFKHRGTRRALVAIALTGLVSTGLFASAAGGAQAGDAPGVSADTVNLGYIFSGSGLASATHRHAGDACKARIGAQNAEGGVHGRQIEMEIIDDQSNPGTNLQSAQDLVQNREVFAVINNSPVAFGAYRFLRDSDVPVIGAGFDGTYYGEKGNEGIISALGNGAPVVGLTYDTVTKVAKQLGAKKMASVAYSISASSTASAEATQKYGPRVAGPRSRVPEHHARVRHQGRRAHRARDQELGRRRALPAARQRHQLRHRAGPAAERREDEGQRPRHRLQPGPARPAHRRRSSSPPTSCSPQYKPVELKNQPRVKEFQANLKKYGGLTGVPDYGTYLGYLTCDMAITGLQEAGENPTRQGFIDGIRNLGEYDGAGLPCAPLDVSYENYGKQPETSCAYYVNLENGKFHVLNKGKPYVGKLIGDPALLKANKTGTATTTTTTAAPA